MRSQKWLSFTLAVMLVVTFSVFDIAKAAGTSTNAVVGAHFDVTTGANEPDSYKHGTATANSGYGDIWYNGAYVEWTLVDVVAIGSYQWKNSGEGTIHAMSFYDANHTLIVTRPENEALGKVVNFALPVKAVKYVRLTNTNPNCCRRPSIDNVQLNTFADDTPPAVPSGLRLTTGTTSATISWSPVSDADAAAYKIYKDGVYVATVDKSQTSYELTGLTVGKIYKITISAVDSFGNESKKSVNSALYYGTRSLESKKLIMGLNDVSPKTGIVNYNPPMSMNVSDILPYAYELQVTGL